MSNRIQGKVRDNVNNCMAGTVDETFGLRSQLLFYGNMQTTLDAAIWLPIWSKVGRGIRDRLHRDAVRVT